MTQMNLPMKHTESQTERTDWLCPAGRWGGTEWDRQMQTIIYRVDTQQGPTIQHREVWSVPCDNPQWRILNIYIYVCVYTHNCITVLIQQEYILNQLYFNV